MPPFLRVWLFRVAAVLSVLATFGILNLVAFPTGHHSAQQVAETQPEKFAAIEGLYDGQTGAPLVLFGLPIPKDPSLKAHFIWFDGKPIMEKGRYLTNGDV